MPYKKYIKRDGKLYGPYIYHSRKEGGRVITDYHGKFDNEKKYLPVGIFLALFLFALVSFSFFNFDSIQNFSLDSITGFVSEDNQENVLLEPLDPVAIIRFVIEIISAEHLNENREFISDIYEEIKAQDDVWSETINDGEFVRVSFEENLTSENIITYFESVFPRDDSGEPSGNPRVEIEGEQNEFFLKVIGGSLKLDFVGGKF